MSTTKFDPAKDIPDLTGKSFFITGGTNGLGAHSAVHLANHNASHIYISGRNAQNAEKIIAQIRDSGSRTEVTFVECDLSSLSSIKQAMDAFVATAPRLDVLMCNAGIMAKPLGLTKDGYELQFGTNHLGHALLIKKLLPLLEKTSATGGDARIILLSSQGMFLHPKDGIDFDGLRTVQDFGIGGPWRRYGQSKLANMLYARQLSVHYPEIVSVSIHPGVVATDLLSSGKLWKRVSGYSTSLGLTLAPEEGAFNQVWAATVEREKIQSGSYYEPVGVVSDKKLDKTGQDDELAKKLWDWTEDALKEY
ncbi:hypothetical protein N7539_000985 [Penicillium diatomitis]|uniref:Oxidoreductase n=1 Tax=Penicillium diatomitis TaxID=2819901 RepID=A0A9W9XMU4_9EURO|nr:uncharacterized protein N7539_000985 [Penicillium diatomitis]KAJ5495869.1 hypothetical protein N7539_000985 [Penicillium diatomitis]